MLDFFRTVLDIGPLVWGFLAAYAVAGGLVGRRYDRRWRRRREAAAHPAEWRHHYRLVILAIWLYILIGGMVALVLIVTTTQVLRDVPTPVIVGGTVGSLALLIPIALYMTLSVVPMRHAPSPSQPAAPDERPPGP
jgi:hypothetical protein